MINILREPNSPVSLQSPEIQQYIDEIQNHLLDPENIPKPKVPGTYRNSDLLEAFDRCFHSKCYLTEQWFPNSWNMDVEHFISQSEDATKRYEWSNLFPAEHRANKMKPRLTPEGGYLDPTNPAYDVENEILYSLSSMGQYPSFEAKNGDDQRAVNTATLLDILHNGHNSDTKKATAGLRHEIQKKYDQILHLILNWLGSPEGSVLKHQYRKELSLHLSKKSSFTMLIRSMAAVNIYVPNELLD